MAGISAKLSEKGQITVPKTIRDVLDLNPGDRVQFVFSDGNILVKRSSPTDEADFMAQQDVMLAETWNTPEDDDAFNHLI